MLDRKNLDLFYRDPYLLKWRATVLACTEGPKGFEVILDQTIFYPEGGGQPADIMRDASKALNKKLCGRGGGANGIVQGSFKADADAIRAAVAETFAA